MSKSSKFDIDLVTLDDIVVTNATIHNPNNIKLAKSEYSINFWFTPGVNVAEKKIRLILTCEIKSTSPSDEHAVITGTFDLAYYFKIDNLEELIKKIKENNDEVIIDNAVSISLANIAYSTSRGIIFTRCQGTALGKVIIPILPNDKIVKIFTDSE